MKRQIGRPISDPDNFFRNARVEMGMTQQQLADYCCIPVGTYKNYELNSDYSPRAVIYRRVVELALIIHRNGYLNLKTPIRYYVRQMGDGSFAVWDGLRRQSVGIFVNRDDADVFLKIVVSREMCGIEA